MPTKEKPAYANGLFPNRLECYKMKLEFSYFSHIWQAKVDATGVRQLEDRCVTTKSLFLVMTILVGLGGCDAFKSSRSDGLPLSEVKMDGRQPIVSSVAAESRYSVTSIEVIIPETLVVSEANQFYPKADIVWRGDPPGDRLAQVKSIMDEGLASGASTLLQGPSVVVSVQLERFHALTEKARYSVGGVHDVVFLLTVKDAETGVVLEGPRRVEIAIRAAGNDVAIAEDEAGRTQRVVIVEGVAEALRRELSGPMSSSPPKKRGLFALFR